MDDKIFLQRLQELARIEYYVEPSAREKSRTKNSTWPVRVKELYSHPRVCEDCGLVCVDRRVEYRRFSQPIAYWRKICSICKLASDPETGRFTVNLSTSYNFFKLYYSKLMTKRRRITK